MENKFDKWNEVKKDINKKENNIYFNQGDIWWVNLGQNIKSESFGKGDNFRRPILVFKKLSSDTCIAIPLSTQHKEGTWFTNYNIHGEKFTALLYQIRMLHKNRFWKKIGQMDENDFSKIKKRTSKFTRTFLKIVIFQKRKNRWEIPKSTIIISKNTKKVKFNLKLKINEQNI